MHICYLTNEYPVPGEPHGGIGSFLGVICPALVAAGHQVSVINGTSGKSKIVQREGVQIHYVAFSKIKGLAWHYNFKAINTELKHIHLQNPIDIVESSELGLAFIAKLSGIRYVIRLHGGHHFFAEGERRSVNRWKAFQEKRSFSKADGFIGVSQYVVNHTGKLLNMKGRPLDVIMYPIALQRFKPEPFEKIIPFKVVFAGTLIEKKGIRQLVLSLEYLIEKYPLLKLHIYGRDWMDSEGNSYKEKLIASIPEKIMEHLEFHGPVDQKSLPEIYASAHVCAFPSHIETLGLVAPEAMATQRAVLYTETGPGPEVVEHGESGWLCNPWDPKDIAEKLADIFDHEDEMKRRAINGCQKVNGQFNIVHILEKNISFYTSLL